MANEFTRYLHRRFSTGNPQLLISQTLDAVAFGNVDVRGPMSCEQVEADPDK